MEKWQQFLDIPSSALRVLAHYGESQRHGASISLSSFLIACGLARVLIGSLFSVGMGTPNTQHRSSGVC